VLLLRAVVVLVSGLGGGPPLTSPEAPLASRPVAARVHVVQPGDTLWSIARSLHPQGDVRDLVDRLAATRGRDALQVGERIVLP
jgi:LysM domain-containing protein